MEPDMGEDKPEAGDEGRKRQRKALSRELPSRLYELEKHFEVLRAFCTIYANTSRPVATKDLTVIPGISVDIVARNTKFYVENGFLSIDKNRTYVPTEEVQAFIKDKKFDRDEQARATLRGILDGKWFVTSAKSALDFHESVKEKDLIDAMAYDAGAEPGNEDLALKVLLDMMVYAGTAVKNEDGTYSAGHQERDRTGATSDESKKGTAEEAPIGRAPVVAVKTGISGMGAVVSVKIVLNVDRDTTPERVRDVMRAVVEGLSNANREAD